MEILESYLSGQWVRGEGAASELQNPTSGETIASCSSVGLDLAGALKFAREVGGPALRALSFAERGALLERMSQAIHGQREALIELCVSSCGNTRSDAKFDLDGASGTLMAYAELGKELGERRILEDGEAIDIGTGSRLQGRHVRLPLRGVAVHIGAFNFPAWGWAEKAACALLAGMPVLTKPATATAQVAYHSFKSVVDAAEVPSGVLSLLCGNPGDLLSHLSWHDVVAFTGSSRTARGIRGLDNLLDRGVRVNVEADSLNAAVLLAGAKDAAYDAFIRDVHRDMTQKAGQKCTAIRRILVPTDDLERVRESLSERLAETRIGDPAIEGVRVGPLATKRQQADVRAAVGELLQASKLAWGKLEGFQLEGADAERGAFVAPLLLETGDAGPEHPVHHVEAFGPVATLIPYDGSVGQAANLVRAAQGSLVTSVYGDDRELAGELLLELLPFNGRVVVTDSKIADRAPGPGTVLPQLLHGGPGRAGGGEELGGLRGLGLYQQRTAVQGNGPLIARYLGG
ncbi:MAG: 3,4-dehydroadipyl-CoA semialdehyde dehydrogenase [Myxococcales bacterium]|nr:3,4-dehydroadipyl-CoA semialdehyde dehydrogenase [Myxococcales bacterium]